MKLRDHVIVCVIAWVTVLISFRLKFVDKFVELLWSHHVGKLLLLVIDTTSKACTHARRNHNRKNTHSTIRYVRLCGENVDLQQWFLTWGKFHFQRG